MIGDGNSSPQRSRGSVALILIAIVGVIIGFGALSVLFSGTITRAELSEISAERRNATAPPSVPQGASDTRQMIRALSDELGTATEQLYHLRFRNGPDWAAWIAVASDPEPRSVGPTTPVSPTVTETGTVGAAPTQLEVPPPPETRGTFDLADVTVLDDLTATDATARRATDLHDAVRDWVVVSGRGDDITVALHYVKSGTDSVVAVVVLDATGDLVEVQR